MAKIVVMFKLEEGVYRKGREIAEKDRISLDKEQLKSLSR